MVQGLRSNLARLKKRRNLRRPNIVIALLSEGLARETIMPKSVQLF